MDEVYVWDETAQDYVLDVQKRRERAMDEMDEYQEWHHMTWGFGMESGVM